LAQALRTSKLNIPFENGDTPMTATTTHPAPTRSVPDQLDIAIGAAIRLRRRQAGLSQEHLAEKCGVTFQQVQKYENGANRVSFSRLVQIAHALGLRIADLVGEIDGSVGLNPVEARALSDLGVTGAIELLRDFADLSPGLRGRVRDLMREIAGSQKA
jgi:transcriptional regulator with XRE-family HTH domain